jgi:hypothetical protein
MQSVEQPLHPTFTFSKINPHGDNVVVPQYPGESEMMYQQIPPLTKGSSLKKQEEKKKWMRRI